MSDLELEQAESLQNEDVENAESESLGVPDFSAIMDDDDGEITIADVGGDEPKAQTELKASFAVKKLMPKIFNAVAKRKGEHWKLEQEEIDLFAESLDETLEHYFPDLNNLPPWASFAVVSGMIFIPRLIIDVDDEDDEIKGEVVATQDNIEVQPSIGQGTVLRPKEVRNG